MLPLPTPTPCPALPLPCTPAGTNVAPLVPALEKIWADSMGQSLADFNFRCPSLVSHRRWCCLLALLPAAVPHSCARRWPALGWVCSVQAGSGQACSGGSSSRRRK